MSRSPQFVNSLTAFLLNLLLVSMLVVSPISVKTTPKEDNLSSPAAENVRTTGEHPPYHSLIRQSALRYGVDYRLIYSIIQQESRFNNEAVSEQGAMGLMQVMPVTGADVNNDASIDHLNLPAGNIHTGIAYFSSLMELFKNATPEDQIKLSLAAYNAGPSRIYDAMEIAAYMGESPLKWAPVKNALPLLSRRYYTLHCAIWKTGKPRSGYFGDSRETITYVYNVSKYYSQFCEKYDKAQRPDGISE